MSKGKETPRQKMIGMMYLILTAMLALNVSKEAVEAFRKVDMSLTKTTANYIKKNDITYAAFDAAAAENPEKAGAWKTKAYEIKGRADELYNYIQDLKVEIITTAEGSDSEALLPDNQIDINKVKKIDENNVPSEILVGANQGGKGNDLKALIEDYREYLVETLEGKDASAERSILDILNTDNPQNLEKTGTEDWVTANFQTMPLVAAITMLSKMQVDVRNAETDVLNFLYTQIDAGAFRFNYIVPTVTTNTSYVMQGNEYEAKVFVAATDTTQDLEIFVGPYTTKTNPDGTPLYEPTSQATQLPIDESGRGVYRVRPGSVGEKSWGGVIRMKAPDGSVRTYKFDQKYSVGMPNVVVSPTAMNVLYQGIQNPLDISVPGVGSDKLTVRMTNGDISKGKYKNYRGEYVAQPRTVGQNAQIIVSANIDGKVQSFPPVEFRVRRLPDPEARFANMKEGNVLKSVAAAQQVVTAVLENFEFDLTYTVTGFTVSVNDKGYEITAESNNNRLTDKQKGLIGNLRAGQKLIIEKIKAVGPDGRTRDLNPIILKIN
ncbi:MAG: gliding motility protein GldM [Bacteroidales bacterium]|jgi:gliding motility-associated protein GldM|nr:gliding motility protein GldM [Bacteroidales bacterium]MDX9926801.1 gliding motility protein GldM [Bacteroidales bacterium]HNX84601.1 gliding motility protein GldM [Bacteroidales bacterium]HPS96850.1 gliding motility protein GldM [Bacteroidales bacterium]